MKKTKFDFKRYCALVKKYVLNEEEINELHRQYIDFQKAIKHYAYTPTEWILDVYSDRTLDKHNNCLKRNKDKNFMDM